ncbi:hypothetical protein J5X84_39660 [Streptosporangiaceae bacterium NEAU-GS5]|nr:hypothetical protein [Streptosporangiaceae bacterium NEAU-GS5]
MEDAWAARARFALRLRALREASGLSVRGLEIASARTPRRRPGQEPIRLPRSTIDGMINPRRAGQPERHNVEVFVDTCIRVAAETGRVLADGLGDPGAWDVAYRELREQTDEREPAPARVRTPRTVEPRSPYRGLEAFGAADADYFFGRDALTAALLDRIDGTGGLLIVMGPSGAGKSSLLRAGLVPALARHPAIDPVVFTPGTDPVQTLYGLAEAGHDTGLDRLPEILGERWSGRAVIVDQFEEVFTADQDLRPDGFIEVVTALGDTSGGPLVVVLGVRADFLGHCSRYPALVPAVERPVVVTPMTRDDLLEVIRGPARLAGLILQDGLADLLLEDLRSDRHHTDAVGVLPLLSHALRETWAHREGTSLTLTGYRASGGIVRSLAQTADATVNALEPAARLVARRLVTRLVQLGVDAADTTRRMPLAELPSDPLVQQVLDHLAQARLLTVDAAAVQITHEALIRGWPRLRTWVEEDRADLVVLQHLDADAAQWDKGGRDTAYLYSGTRLLVARDAYAASSWAQPAADATTRAFLAASQETADRARRAAVRRRRLARVALIVVTALAVVASVAGVLAMREADRAEAQRRQTLSRLLTARGEAMRAADPVTAGLLSAAAWHYAPTAEARAAMLATLATPLNAVLDNPSADITAVAVSRDGQTVATGDTSGAVRLWDIDGRPKGQPLTGHRSPISRLVFSRDGALVASGDGDENHDGTVLVRAVASGRTLTPPLTGHEGRVTAMAFSRDDATLTTADENQIVQRWNTGTWRRLGLAIGPLHEGRNTRTQLSPDGSVLALQTLRVALAWDWRMWNPVTRRPYGGTIPGIEMAFSPDGRTIISSWNDTVGKGSIAQQWDFIDHREIEKSIRFDFPISSMTYSPDGRTIAIGHDDGAVSFLDARSQRPTGAVLHGHSSYITDLAYSGDGTRLVTAAKERNARIWDTTTWAQVSGSKPAVGGFTAATISADGRALAAYKWTSGGHHRLESVVLDTTTGRPTGTTVDLGLDATYSITSPGNGVVLGRDGHLLVVAAAHLVVHKEGWATTDRTRLMVTDLVSGRGVGRLDLDSQSIDSIAISPDDSMIATLGTTITLRSTATLRQVTASPAVRSNISAIAFTSDGKAIMVAEPNYAGTTGVIRVLRVSDWTQTGNPFPISGAISAMTVSRDGTYLATSDYDGTLRLWDVQTRRQIAVAPPVGATKAPVDLKFSPDGTALLAVDSDGVGKRWPLRLPADPYKAMCAVAGRSLTWQEWGRFLPPGEPYTATCG